jgi:hypothetical protein
VTSIIFLVPRATTAWDRDRWGFELLKERGIGARGVDLSLVFRADSGEPNDSDIRPRTRQEFSELVRSAAGTTVFVDYLRGVSGPDLSTAWIFRELKTERAIYYVVAAGSLPTAATGRRKLLRAFIKPIRAVRHVASLAERVIAERFGGYVPPYKVFGPPAAAVNTFALRYSIPPERLIPTHSLDYDALFRSGTDAEPIAPACVFVDDGLAGHPDFDSHGRSSADPTRYAQALRRVFDRIELATGYPVVIAAHPRSEALREGMVGGRRIIRGRTADAVATSVLVLGHASTALGFAALRRKPVILLSGRHVADAGLGAAVSAMASALDAPVIDPDDEEAVALLKPDLSRVPTGHYERYLVQHVRPSDAPDKSLWEIIAQHAVNDLARRNESA